MLRWLRQVIASVVEAVREARRAPKPPKLDESVPVYVPEQYGPVVESRDVKTPVPLAAVPVRSTKGDAKRHARRVVEAHVGESLSWKQARKRIRKLAREDAQVRDVPDPKRRTTFADSPEPPEAA